MSHYDEYFDAQIGGGTNFLDNLGSLCTAESCQRGSGLGGFLGGVYRRVLPILTRGSKAIGKEVMRAGYNVVSDIAHDKMPLRNSIESRLRVSGNALKQKAERKLNQLFEEKKYKRMGEPDDIQSLPDSEPESTESSGKKKKSNDTPKTQKKQNREASILEYQVKSSMKRARNVFRNCQARAKRIVRVTTTSFPQNELSSYHKQ
ncbi:hypothetical protein QAD02_007508 [Eretmocerus hayati]|uniref:Uncharacterized protein n=1 Tax=Eretmocerus hayati TaxID=131215 RepID=A0ACC2N569_9HYME|nr:hypothetical protein QAD02_007508 [Eretmocerus hayati]